MFLGMYVAKIFFFSDATHKLSQNKTDSKIVRRMPSETPQFFPPIDKQNDSSHHAKGPSDTMQHLIKAGFNQLSEVKFENPGNPSFSL